MTAALMSPGDDVTVKGNAASSLAKTPVFVAISAARELPADPSIAALIARHSASVRLAVPNGLGGEHVSRIIDEAVGVALQALNNLADQLHRDRPQT